MIVVRDLLFLLVGHRDPPELRKLAALLAVRVLVDVNRIITGLLRRFLGVAVGVFGDEEDRGAVFRPFERPNRAFMIGELRRFAAADGDHPDLRAAAIATRIAVATGGLIARGQKRHVLTVWRPGRAAILVAAQKLMVVGSVRV